MSNHGSVFSDSMDDPDTEEAPKTEEGRPLSSNSAKPNKRELSPLDGESRKTSKVSKWMGRTSFLNQSNKSVKSKSGFVSEFALENYLTPSMDHIEVNRKVQADSFESNLGDIFADLGQSGVKNHEDFDEYNDRQDRDEPNWLADMDLRKRETSICANICGGFCSAILILAYFVLFPSIPGLTGSLFSINFNARDDISSISIGIISLGGAGVGLYILLDFFNSKGKMRFCGDFMLFLSFLILVAGLIVVFRNQAVVSYAVYLAACTFFTSILKGVVFPRADGLDYITALLTPILLAIALTVSGFSIFWRNNRWTSDVIKAQYLFESNCPTFDRILSNVTVELSRGVDLELLSDLAIQNSDTPFLRAVNVRAVALYTNISEASSDERTEEFGTDFECLDKALDLYISPLYFVILGIMFCLILSELRKLETLRRMERGKIKVGVSTQATVILLGLLGISAWVVTTVLNAFAELVLGTVVLIFGMSIFAAVYVFGTKYLSFLMTTIPLGQAALGVIKSNFAAAAAVFFGFFPFVVFAMISVIIQAVRKYTFFGKTITEKSERDRLVTLEVIQIIEFFQSLDMGHVYRRVIFVGLFFFIFVVIISRFVTIFLSILAEVLGSVSLGVTTVIFVITGLTCFLLPPVPGLPVFLAGGIILFVGAKDTFGDVGAMAYAVVVNFFIKLGAVSIQQKIIGQKYGSQSVYVRSLVNINSDSIKAIKILMQKEGFNLPKIAILCGGPDWPTSVLTGILRLPLLQMLIGTVPVILLVMPSTLAGAFLVFDSDDESIDGDDQSEGDINALRTIFLTSTILVQGVFFVIALHYILKTTIEEKSLLDKIPDDEEVIAYEAENKKIAELKMEATSWNNLSPFFQTGHKIAALLMISSCLCFQFLGLFAFVDFSATDTVSDKLDGNVLKVFKPAGWAFLAMFSAALMYNKYFNRTIDKEVSLMLSTKNAADDSIDIGNEPS